MKKKMQSMNLRKGEIKVKYNVGIVAVLWVKCNSIGNQSEKYVEKWNQMKAIEITVNIPSDSNLISFYIALQQAKYETIQNPRIVCTNSNSNSNDVNNFFSFDFNFYCFVCNRQRSEWKSRKCLCFVIHESCYFQIYQFSWINHLWINC